MRTSRHRTTLGRGILATLAALVATLAVYAIIEFPSVFSDSAVPRTALDGTGVVILMLGFAAGIRLFWLLPGCVLAQTFIVGRRPIGFATTLRLALISVVVSVCGLLVSVELSGWPPAWAVIRRRLPLALETALFLLVWFVVFWALAPHRHSRASARGLLEPTASGRSPRIRRRVATSVFVAAAIIWTWAVGFLAGGLMDFGGEGQHRLEYSVPSPGGHMRADVVTYFSPGGVLGDDFEEVYLNDARTPWRADRRGLMIWQGSRVDVDTVLWASDRALRVRVASSAGGAKELAADDAQGFSRRGFVATTEVSQQDEPR